MDTAAIVLLGLSASLQIVAAWLAWRLVTVTRSPAWAAMSAALGLMAARRLTSLAGAVAGEVQFSRNGVAAEVIALLISALLLFSLTRIRPLCMALAATGERLRQDRARLERLYRVAGLAEWAWDSASDRLFWSPAMRALLGERARAHYGPLKEFLARLQEEDAAELRQAFHAAARGEAQVVNANVRVHGRDGAEWVMRMQGAPVSALDGRWEGTIQDVTALSRARDRLRELGSKDTLSGLLNRESLLRELDFRLRRRRRADARLALVVLDLDQFKDLNDSLGHHAGDEILAGCAARLRAGLRESDEAARLGGDEFGILIDEFDQISDVGAVVERALRALEHPFVVGGRELRLTASAGVAVCPEDGLGASVLFQHAELALFRAKQTRRGGLEFYRPSLGEEVRERLDLEGDLWQAIALGRFRLEYQPQIDLASGRTVGAEALLRWTHPGRGAVSPEVFVPILERSGRIVEVGEWVLRSACEEFARERDGSGQRVAVNVSPVQLTAAGWVDTVRHCLHESGLQPGELELEITESSIMREQRDSLEVLHELAGQGIHLAIDDFGTGYSSLAQLKALPLRHLKLDRCFVAGLEDDPADRAIVDAVLGMARRLDLSVTAEGVENEAQHRYLKERRCHQIQGYWVRRPGALGPALATVLP